MTDENQLAEIRISVRNLVEFLLASGDIDKSSSRIDSDAMAMGRAIHKKVQSRGGAGYRAEVALSDTRDFPEDGFSLTVEGRADGIIDGKNGYTIDEIKGMFLDVTSLTEPVPVHLAQAKCYAYMFLKKLREDPGALPDQGNAKRKGSKAGRRGRKRAEQDKEDGVQEAAADPQPAAAITVQLTYVNLDTEQVRRLKQEYSWEELSGWYTDLTGQYRRWAKYTVDHRKERQESIRKMGFPYPYREGQRKLVASVYRTIEQKKNLFIQAPTGSGKTLATVFPAVKAVGEGMGDRVFYLTARTITRTVAEDCFKTLKTRGLSFRVVTITSKEKVCPMLPPLRSKDDDAKPPCSPETCPYAKGHFDRVGDTVYELLMSGKDLCREEILLAAEEHKVCPFELTLDLTGWTDGVICDYNYVFDPTAKLQRFFGGEAKTDAIFLIDEAHNLVDRGRDMYSADLYLEDFTMVRLLLKRSHCGLELQRSVEECERFLEGERKETRESMSYRKADSAGDLPVRLLDLMGQIEKFLKLPHSDEISEQVLSFYFRVQEFSGALDRFSDKYVMTERMTEDGRFQLKVSCLDPSADLQACMDRGRSSILFSATLLPIGYYRSLISARTDDYAVYASSIFDPSKRKVLIGTDVSTRYQDRGPAVYRRIAEYIGRVTAAEAGNYMVFFSSYRMMEDVEQAYEEIRRDDVDIAIQQSRMTEAERETFLRKFTGKGPGGAQSAPRTLIGFCVMGSFFGEGIDLRGESLIGVIVVGTALPQVGTEREILKNYFDRRGMDGFFYSYTCPGMAKVLQAAGRVIRTEEDRGVILLIDERFSRRTYREMFPREWSDAEYVTLDNIVPRLEQFWKTL